MIQKRVFLLLFLLGLALASLSGTVQAEETKLTASDGTHFDLFGRSVAISGRAAVVGAPGDDPSGSAYVFNQDLTTAVWSEVAKLTAADATTGVDFGRSVAISEGTIVVGAPWDDENGFRSGSAYLFEKDPGGLQWIQVIKLTANDASEDDQFGTSVAIDGDTVVIGAHWDDDLGDRSGSAYVFHRNAGGLNGWGQVAKLVASDAAEKENFGERVGIHADTIVVGAPTDHELGAVWGPGSAYVFRLNPNTGHWSEEAKLTASDGALGDLFGIAIAVHGNTILVGAPDSDRMGQSSGAAYLFECTTSVPISWSEMEILTAPDTAEHDRFGGAVALSGDKALVGAATADQEALGAGTSYVFRHVGATGEWTQTLELYPSDFADYKQFGISVGLDETHAFVGAWGDQERGDNAGAAYLFALEEGTFTTETEPNNSCPAAQSVGPIGVPFTVFGSLVEPPVVPDVDFFRFTSVPGTALVVDLEGSATNKGTLVDPYLGLFNSDCDLMDINDDFMSLDSHIEFVVPPDGVFVLAASSCCDSDFDGDGHSSGTYQLTISLPPPAIGSIKGRVVNEVSGQPLSGDSWPYAYVELRRCVNDDCVEHVASMSASNDGTFYFERDYWNRLLSVGRYQVTARAYEFTDGASAPFDVGEAENRDIGDIPLYPPPVLFSDIQPCQDLPLQGGLCSYSVRIDNNTAFRMRGMAWSHVEGWGIGSPLGHTLFEASKEPKHSGGRRFSETQIWLPDSTRHRVKIDPLSITRVRFRFSVPSYVSEYATFCTRLFFGLDPRPLFGTVREGSLFCMTKGGTGFRVMSEQEIRVFFQSFGAQSRPGDVERQ